MLLEIMQKAPAFSLFDHKGVKHSLSDYKDSFVLLYFYPKDFTPGCTAEACSLRDVNKELKKAGVVVLGVSLDDMDSHKKFVKEYKLPFAVLTDEKLKMSEAYGALVTKDNGKKITHSLTRISYLIDPKGKIVKVYAKVNPAKHADQILKDITKINEDIKLEEMAKRLIEKEKLAKKAVKDKAAAAKEKIQKDPKKPAKKMIEKKTPVKKAVIAKKIVKSEIVINKPQEVIVQEIVEITDESGNTEIFIEEESINI